MFAQMQSLSILTVAFMQTLEAKPFILHLFQKIKIDFLIMFAKIKK